MTKPKMMSLFSGIGGFELAASLCGIETIYASEIEPFPIIVTKTRLPEIKHLGDISKIDGTSIEPVDIITFGSPCQDLSVAGKRAGLAGERSGLFMEAVRIIKEMRSTYEGSDEPIQPRFAVWENVPGAFSSNKGEDFRAVLEEICRVKDETVTIPRPPKGKWSYSGTIMGNGWSIAWRVLDAQFWGVPQRRRRIFLVADFRGQSAPEILFKRKGLPRHLAESEKAREKVTAGVGAGIENAIGLDAYQHHNWRISDKFGPITTGVGRVRGDTPLVTYGIQGSMIGRADKNGPQGDGINEGLSFTLNTTDRHAVAYGVVSKGNGEAWVTPERHMALNTGGGQAGQGYPAVLTQEPKVYGICSDASNSMKSDNPHSGICEADTTRTLDQNGGNLACNQGGMAVVQAAGFNGFKSVSGSIQYQEESAATLEANMPGNVAIYSFQRSDEYKETDEASTQSRRQYKDATDLVVSPTYALDRASFNQGKNAHSDMLVAPYQETVGSLCARDYKGIGNQYVSEDKCIIAPKYSVRRLTPLECERLQGFPDGWTDIPGQTEATQEELEFWRDVWFTWDKIQAEDPEKVKPRTDNRLLRWLKNPTSDSAQYKALGNSVAIPCVEYTLEGISEVLERSERV